MGKLRAACCACVASMALASAAGAESYSLVSGSLGDQPLEGSFEAVLGSTEGSVVGGQLGGNTGPGYQPPDVRDRLEDLQNRRPSPPDPSPSTPLARELDLGPEHSIAVADFGLASGDRVFTPPTPTSHAGLRPLRGALRPAGEIQLADGGVQLFTLRSGGDVVEADGDRVTFRFLELRATEGRAVGGADGGLPRRIEVRGSVREVDESYEIVEGVCPTPIPPPDFPLLLPGGVFSIEPGADELTVRGTLTGDVSSAARLRTGDLAVRATPADAVTLQAAPFEQPAGRVVVDVGVGREPEASRDEPSAGATLFALNPIGLELEPAASVTADRTPVVGPVTASAGQLTILNEVPGSLSDGTGLSLPDGVSSPDGLTVAFAADGVLTIETHGDLFVEEARVDVPGLTALLLRAARDIFITGFLEVPPGVDLRIEAGRSVDVAGDIIADGVELGDPVVTPGPIVPGPIPCLAPLGLLPLGRETRPVGPFSFVASTARPAAVDVDPRRRHNRVHPHKRRFLPVALLGSAELDVRDVDPETLRLGDGGAPPLRFGGWLWLPRADLNRDGFTDLMALFDSSKAGIAFGDESLCLVAEKADGELLEGCDTIDARPRSRRQLLDALRSRQ